METTREVFIQSFQNGYDGNKIASKFGEDVQKLALPMHGWRDYVNSNSESSSDVKHSMYQGEVDAYSHNNM